MSEQHKVTESPIPGLFVIDIPLHGDERGWFKESYQKEKLEALGLPEFDIVQNNMSYNEEAGVTRGLHAEPWEKYITVANGRVFGAWVDLRNGPSFGTTFTTEITPEKAVFVPRGVANGYQTLDPKVTYTYLVNEHWSPEAKYTFLNLFDKHVAIDWPISRSEAIVSEKDKNQPMLDDVIPMDPVRDLGASNGMEV
jgi:dTDP-4-dehydrorhamnose 3,5-epimerase